MEQVFVKFTDVYENVHEIEVTADAVITMTQGEVSKTLSMLAKTPRANVALNDMTAEELKLEIRNSKSVQYKAKKAATDAGKLEDEKYIETQAGRDARVEAAIELMKTKFPGVVTNITSSTTPKNTKLAKAQAIREALAGSDLPEAAKEIALAKMDELLAVLKTATRTKKPAIEVAAEAQAQAQTEAE